MHEDAKCRECSKWNPTNGLVGECSAPGLWVSWIPGRGYGCAPNWFGSRRCNAFEPAIGAIAASITEAIAKRLLAEPLQHRRVLLARMQAEDAPATECVKARMIELHHEARS